MIRKERATTNVPGEQRRVNGALRRSQSPLPSCVFPISRIIPANLEGFAGFATYAVMPFLIDRHPLPKISVVPGLPVEKKEDQGGFPRRYSPPARLTGMNRAEPACVETVRAGCCLLSGRATP
jgi:hypothetical protein